MSTAERFVATIISSDGTKDVVEVSGIDQKDAEWITTNGYELIVEALPQSQIAMHLAKDNEQHTETTSYIEPSESAIARLVQKVKGSVDPHAAIMEMINSMDSTSKQFAISFKTVPNMKGGMANPFKDRVEKLTSGAKVEVYADCSTWAERLAKEAEAKGEPPYVAKPRRWGTRIESSPFIKHTKDGEDRLYLEMFMVSPGETHYTIDGVIATKDQMDDLAPYLPKSQSNDLGILLMNVDNIKGMVEV